MSGDRQTDEERTPAGGASDPAHRLAERHLLRSEDRDRRVGQARIAERRRLEDPCDVVDGDRPDRSIPQADEAEDRERVEGVAQVVEHVVAAPVDDAGLEDRVGQARGTDELLGGPLRAVVGRRAVRAGAQEAQHHDPRNAGRPCRLDDRGRATDVDRLVRLGAELSIDARAVDDRLATTERGGQFGRAGRVQPGSGRGARRPRSRGQRLEAGRRDASRRSRSHR